MVIRFMLIGVFLKCLISINGRYGSIRVIRNLAFIELLNENGVSQQMNQ